jgi:signal transduction histidine kinase
VTLGALEELERESAIDNQQRILLGMARRGALKVLRTADRLSRISQLESKTLTLSLAPTDICEVTRRAFADARALEPRKGVEVELTLPTAPHLIPLDETWAHTAILELIWSALRAARTFVRVTMPSLGTVQISNDSLVWAGAAKRQENHGQKDSALSIALADEIAKLHGGEVRMIAEDAGAYAILAFGKQT